MCRNAATDTDLHTLKAYVAVVADGARCSLASQQQVIVGSLLRHFAADVDAHRARLATPHVPALIAELRDIPDGVAIIDERHRAKQPDWTYNSFPSGKTPAAGLAEHRGRQCHDA